MNGQMCRDTAFGIVNDTSQIIWLNEELGVLIISTMTLIYLYMNTHTHTHTFCALAGVERLSPLLEPERLRGNWCVAYPVWKSVASWYCSHQQVSFVCVLLRILFQRTQCQTRYLRESLLSFCKNSRNNRNYQSFCEACQEMRAHTLLSLSVCSFITYSRCNAQVDPHHCWGKYPPSFIHLCFIAN